MTTYEIHIPSIECAACATPIENVIKQCQNVSKVNINTITKIATITISDQKTDSTIATSEKELEKIKNLQKKSLIDAIEDIGHTCNGIIEINENEQASTHTLLNNNTINPSINASTRIINNNLHVSTQERQAQIQANKIKEQTSQIIRSHWIKGILGVLCGVVLMALSIWGMGIPFIALYILGGASSLLTLYLGKDTYKHAAVTLVKSKSLGMESLFTVSTLVAVGVSCASFFFPWLPMLFDAALLILGFKNIGKAIEESAKQKISTHSFRSYAPKQITVETNSGLKQKVEVSSLVPNNIIIVYKGETIPVDGICLSEDTSISDTQIYGETIPKAITIGDKIDAGCVVPHDVDFIRIKVTAIESHSYLALLDKKINIALKEKANIETSTSKVLHYFIPTVFAIAAISAIIVGICISPVAAIQCGIAILVSACPCTLGLVTPLAIKTGITKAAENGVVFKSGKAIEAASQVDTVIFDLNGTLTTGKPRVTHSTIPNDMLSIVAAIEKKSEHPIAKAITNYANARISNANDIKSIQINKLNYNGISAQIDSDNYSIGNKALMATQNINTNKFDQEMRSANAEHVIYLAKNREIIGYILLQDKLRDDAKATIDHLKKLGKNIYICTGTVDTTAQKYANQLGISFQNIKPNCKATSDIDTDNTKTKFIKELTAKGHRVAMIGDAGNDAPAVAASHFSIAINSANSDEITRDLAGATIHKNSLWPIVNAFSIADQTASNIKQNLGITISYNLLSVIAFSGLLVAIGFALNPAIGALLMIIQTGIILMNVERFRRQSIPATPAVKIEHKPTLQPSSTYASLSPTFGMSQLEVKAPIQSKITSAATSSSLQKHSLLQPRITQSPISITNSDSNKTFVCHSG